MSPTPTNPAALLREAADRAREIGDPLHTALALWLSCERRMAEFAHLWTEREACGWCDTPAAGHALTVARQILGTSVCPECGTSGACNGGPCPLGTTTGQPATAPWPPTGDQRPDHELYVTLRKAGLDPAPAQQMIDTYTQTILAVLPTPAVDRATVADALADADGWEWAPGFDKTRSPSYQGYLRQADAVLAVLAAEAQQPTPDETDLTETADDAARRFARRLHAVERLCSGRPGYHTITVKALLTAMGDADEPTPAATEEPTSCTGECDPASGAFNHGRTCPDHATEEPK